MKRRLLLIVLCTGFLLTGCNGNEAGQTAAYESVEEMVSDAAQSFESGAYEDALKKYADAVRENPIDMDAQLGMVKCQLALENYQMAARNLSAAAQVDPTNEGLYELYLQLSVESGNLSYARTAVSLAQNSQMESFLGRVPQKPEISLADGSYDSRMEVTVTAEEGAEIYVTERTDSSSSMYQYTGTPIPITRGKTDLNVYCVKDGIPSETVSAHYVCEYEPFEVTFSDPVIEMLVRIMLGKTEGTITDIECEEITRLDLYDLYSMGMDWEEYENVRINTLEDLKLLPNLEQLNLENQDSSLDYSPLMYSRKLYFLQITNSDLSDISFVGNLSGLEYFMVRNNQISDISPLAGCKNLYGLYIQGNPVSNLSALADLDLRDLGIDAEQMTDFSELKNWKNLGYLSIDSCGGKDLSDLGELRQLESLNLSTWGNNGSDSDTIRDISFLKNLTQLEQLTLDGLEDYSQLEVVKTLSNLTYLYFSTLEYEEPSEGLIQELQQSLPNCDIQY